MNLIGLLVVLVLILASTVSLVIYVVFWCLGLWRRKDTRYRPEYVILPPKSQEENTWNSDLYKQMQLDQQWLFSQLLSEGHDDPLSSDFYDPLTNWLD